MNPPPPASRLRLPSGAGRGALAVAAATWGGVLLGTRLGSRLGGTLALAALAATVAAAWRLPRWVLPAAALAAGILAGAALEARHERVLQTPLEPGPVRLTGRAATDTVEGRHGRWLLLDRWQSQTGEGGPPLLISGDLPEVAVGSRVAVEGVLQARSGEARGQAFAGVVAARRLETLAAPSGPLWGTATALRRRVLEGVAGIGPDPAAGLLAGFLIGDVSGVGEADRAALRRAGLSHFVAVSGSNVALFLVFWWLLLAPAAVSPRTRALAGLAGLAVFVIATRWEPSVIRAAAMAGLVLAGRLVGIPLGAWEALAWAVTGSLLLAPQLASDLGFQLSVAATGGVVAGAGWLSHLRPRAVGTVLGATVAAQLAVTPLLLATVGSVPLAAPLTNLVAAPLVALATATGGVGLLLGFDPLTLVGRLAAAAVLAVARLAAPWPQLGVAQVLGLLAAGVVVARRPSLRPLAALAGAVALAVVLLAPGVAPPRPALVALDVGQGDALLLLGRSATVLVDGGPDPARLVAGLHRYGVRRLDLVVLSHPHADHAAGLLAAVGTFPIGQLWEAAHPHTSPAYEELMAATRRHRVPVSAPPVGSTVRVGDLRLRVLGPERRFASPNDQSIVLLVDAGGPRVLLAGDIEVTAQRQLGAVPAEVLKVPHQGAATSDPDWLADVSPQVAVVSVGPNDFGHPAEWVVELLETQGAVVRRTDREGDVVVPLRG